MYDIEALARDSDYLQKLGASFDGDGPPPLLRDAKIKITSRCNLRCQMCSYWKTERETALSTDQWRHVISQMAELGCRKIHFSGGEVFLRTDFLDIVEHTVGCGIKANMTTNGTLIDKEKAKRIVDARVNSVSISFDGPTARLHDKIRGRDGAFKKSLRTVRWLQRFSAGAKRPVRVRINFVVMRDNFRRLPEMVELAGSLGAVDLNAMPVDEKGERKNRLSRSQIEEYNRVFAPRVLELRQRYGFSLAPDKVYLYGVTREEIQYSKQGLYARGFFERRSCLVPWLHMFVAWDGNVYLCCMTNGRIESLGNVRETTVREVFHGERYREVRRSFAAGEHFPVCHRCDLFLGENARLHEALATGSTIETAV